jgi:hypothetical protein
LKEGTKMSILLKIVLAISLISIAFDRVISYEFQRYIFKEKKLGLNLGKILNKNQVKAVLELLSNEDITYGIQEKRLNIFAYRWQFVPFYLIRQVLAHALKSKELNETITDVFDEEIYEIGNFCENYNFIEIYEFNLIKWCDVNNIDVKESLIKVIFHEYRHKYQYNLNMRLNEEEAEKDAKDFSENFFIKNKLKIEGILAEDINIINK